MNRRAAVPIALAAVSVAVAIFLAPITQNPHYHAFADHRTILGIPNFWNVATNLPFLAVALWGARAVRAKAAFQAPWERVAYAVVLIGTALVAFGSGYYHWHPDDATLFWDRLPMTVVFMSLLAATIGERLSPRAGRLLLPPLLAIGVVSALLWKWTGDLRPYVLVQFYPMLALPLLLLTCPPRYTGAAAFWAMISLYGVAKLLELADAGIGAVIATGGHPWKHIAAAGSMACYAAMVATRRPLIERSVECRRQ
jgi:hypothetical protein